MSQAPEPFEHLNSNPPGLAVPGMRVDTPINPSKSHTRTFGGELDSRARQACEEKVVVQSHVNNLPIIPDAELNRLDTLQQVVLE